MSDDLEAKLVVARDDLRNLAQALRHAWDLELGYGPTGRTGESTRHRDTESPVLSDGLAPELAEQVHVSLRHLEAAHHWYGELGQTVWPEQPLCDTPPTKDCPTRCPRHQWLDHHRTVKGVCPLKCSDSGKLLTFDGEGWDHDDCPLTGCDGHPVKACRVTRVLVCQQLRRPSLHEALEGAVLLAVALAVLQQSAEDFVSVQKTAYALLVAEHATQALRVLPTSLWCAKPSGTRVCVDCGRAVQDTSRRCYACRQRLSRAVRRMSEQTTSL